MIFVLQNPDDESAIIKSPVCLDIFTLYIHTNTVGQITDEWHLEVEKSYKWSLLIFVAFDMRVTICITATDVRASYSLVYETNYGLYMYKYKPKIMIQQYWPI